MKKKKIGVFDSGGREKGAGWGGVVPGPWPNLVPYKQPPGACEIHIFIQLEEEFQTKSQAAVQSSW